MTTYTQKDILKCSIVGDYKFYIQTDYAPGMPWSEEHCPRFRYKTDAKEWIKLAEVFAHSASQVPAGYDVIYGWK